MPTFGTVEGEGFAVTSNDDETVAIFHLEIILPIEYQQ